MRPGAGQVDQRKIGSAECAVEIQGVEIAQEKCGVRRQLELADGEHRDAAKELLFDSGLEKPRRRPRLDAADGRAVEDIISSQAAAMNLIGIDMKRGARQPGDPFKVAVDRHFQQTFIDGALPDPPEGLPSVSPK